MVSKFNVRYVISPSDGRVFGAKALGYALFKLGRDFLYWRNHDIDLSTVKIECEPVGNGMRAIRVSGYLRD